MKLDFSFDLEELPLLDASFRVIASKKFETLI